MSTPQERYEAYLKTDYWQEVSRLVKKRAGFRCQVCNSPHNLVAHHRTYDHRGKELEHLDDLTCLCSGCHEIFHRKTPAAVPQPAFVPPQIRTDHPLPECGRDYEERLAFANQECAHLPPRFIMSKLQFDKTRTNGSFTSATLRAFGLPTKRLKAGWKRNLCAVMITREMYHAALMGVGAYSGKRGKKQKG